MSEEKKQKEDTPLKELRDGIDSIDKQILDLVNQRSSISLQVGRHKANTGDPIYRPMRESKLLEKLTTSNSGPVPDAHLRNIYREIMASSRNLQHPERVAYLGPKGTFSYFAALENLGHQPLMEPKHSFQEIFRSVAEGDANLGVIPLENSMQGTVGQNLDLFSQFTLYIQAEFYSRIAHNLLSFEDNVDNIKRVYSHPQPLNQCADWLHRNLNKVPLIPVESTAAAAERAIQDGPESGSAAIGHRQLAEGSALSLLAERIEDEHDNWTRFAVIGAAPGDAEGECKTSVLFTVHDRPGSLAEILNLLAGAGINLTKLESRPSRTEKWRYVFFADLQCNVNTDTHKLVMNALRQRTHTLRVLGSYPKATHV